MWCIPGEDNGPKGLREKEKTEEGGSKSLPQIFNIPPTAALGATEKTIRQKGHRSIQPTGERWVNSEGLETGEGRGEGEVHGRNAF